MRGEGESSSLHQPHRSATLSVHSETLHIHAHMAIKRKPNILQEFGKLEQTLHCLAHVIFPWLMAALGFNGHANCWSILVCAGLQKPLPLSTAPALKPYCGTSGRPVNPACTREKENRAVIVVGIVCSLPLALGRSWEQHKYSTGRESLYLPHALTSVTQILMIDFFNVHFIYFLKRAGIIL